MIKKLLDDPSNPAVGDQPSFSIISNNEKWIQAIQEYNNGNFIAAIRLFKVHSKFKFCSFAFPPFFFFYLFPLCFSPLSPVPYSPHLVVAGIYQYFPITSSPLLSPSLPQFKHFLSPFPLLSPSSTWHPPLPGHISGLELRKEREREREAEGEDR